MTDHKSPASPGGYAVAYRPLVEACADHGISRSVAFELARSGTLDTFTIGKRRYVRLDSLHSLPDRLAGEGGAA